MKQPNISWEETYRAKYEGANVWSSKAIDSQIEFIQSLLRENEGKCCSHCKCYTCEARANQERYNQALDSLTPVKKGSDD